MADARSRRTGEHSADVIKLMTEAAQMREQLAALTARVVRLEEEAAAHRPSAPPRGPAAPGAPRPAAASALPSSGSALAGPPPLPKAMPALPVLPGRRTGARKSFVDISEMAELVDSIPPPPPRPTKK